MFYKIVSFDSPLTNRRCRELRVFLDQKHIYSDDSFEYLFVVGGDGTFLHFAKKYAFDNKKIVGVKSGHVAFLATDKIDDVENLEFSNLELLKIEGEKKTFYALNDLYITGDKNLLLNLNMNLNGCDFQKYRGTGLLLSTKAGSTAKNKSLLGPVIFPRTNAWLISEIGAQSTKKIQSLNSSMVVSGEDVLEILNLKSYRIFIDGKFVELNDSSLKISLVKATSKVRFANTEEYINRLKKIFIS